jgi:alanine racemase
VSSAISGREASAAGARPRSAPVARVSSSALARNAGIATRQGARHYATSLLDADAWGHGERLVREILGTRGCTPLPGDGVAGDPHERLTVDPETLFGLPGGDPEASPALRLHGTILSVKALRAGEGVSYGYAYRAARDTRVALVTGGYAQGIVRALGNAADVMIDGSRHPIVGRVAMDVCVVEIGDAAARRGDEALFLGDPRHGEPSLAEWVAVTGMQPVELITAVGLRSIREVAP